MNDELKQKVIDEILALTERVEIPPGAVTIRDLMANGMSESSAYRTLKKLHLQGKLQRARGHQGAYYYWPVEENTYIVCKK